MKGLKVNRAQFDFEYNEHADNVTKDGDKNYGENGVDYVDNNDVEDCHDVDDDNDVDDDDNYDDYA